MAVLVAADAGIERAIAELRVDAGAVVVDGRAARAARRRRARATPRVRACRRALSTSGMSARRTMSGSPSASGRSAGAATSTSSNSRASAARSTLPVGGVDLVAGDREQRVDRLAQARRRAATIARSASSRSSSASVPVALQRQLGAQLQAGERRAQLVRDLAREALLVPARRGDAGEQPVERRRQAGELVARRRRARSGGRGRARPSPRALVGHLRDRAQRAVRARCGWRAPRRAARAPRARRAEQDLLLQALERLGRVADDDGADRPGAPARPDRLGAQPDVVRAVGLGGPPRAPERDGEPVQRRGRRPAAARSPGRRRTPTSAGRATSSLAVVADARRPWA